MYSFAVQCMYFLFQRNMKCHSCVEDLYRGCYSYMTRCEGCGGVSGVESPFYELELSVQNCSTLHSSLEQFFKVLQIEQRVYALLIELTSILYYFHLL